MHSAGVHGVEGYAGSAVQLKLLEKFASSTRGDDHPTVVLVHAVNPYGMAHFRRFNENNVDLNRNALTPSEWIGALSREPNIAGYFDIDETFNPPRPPTHLDAYLIIPFNSVRLIAKLGFTHVKRALVAAQYSEKGGIFYGGRKMERSNQVRGRRARRN